MGTNAAPTAGQQKPLTTDAKLKLFKAADTARTNPNATKQQQETAVALLKKYGVEDEYMAYVQDPEGFTKDLVELENARNRIADLKPKKKSLEADLLKSRAEYNAAMTQLRQAERARDAQQQRRVEGLAEALETVEINLAKTVNKPRGLWARLTRK